MRTLPPTEHRNSESRTRGGPRSKLACFPTTLPLQPEGTHRRTIQYINSVVQDRVDDIAEMIAQRVSPIHISFPLLTRPRLAVRVRRRFTPETKGNILTIEVTSTSSMPVEVTDVSVGFMHTFLPAELLLGKRSTTFRLNELSGDSPPPHVLGGGSVEWKADLDQVKEPLVHEQLKSSPRLRRMYAELTKRGYPRLDHFYTDLLDVSPEMDDGPRGRLAVKVNNVVRRLTHKRLAVVIRYGQNGLYKAQTTWERPQGDSLT